ncbi:MAG: prolyl oligopeptidase family serine peptidase, partial [Myxococcota bacterium]
AAAALAVTLQGDRPFLDRRCLADDSAERVFECGEDHYAYFLDFGPEVGGARSLIVHRESPKEPGNVFWVKPDGGEVQLTAFRDPHPHLTGIQTRLVKYERDDGVPLSGTLYLPPEYEEGQRLPLVVWAYPVEYNDASTAGQVRAQPTKFTRLTMTSPLMFVTRGYAVLDRATMPVVGDPETMNDTFVEQIVGAARAAVDALDEAGIVDPARVGVGGHSYGAFMVANLLAHSRGIFRAGIARSGAYNRSLTPFGFQSERRTLWQTPETYVRLSPFFHAQKIEEPLLMIHGEVDSNSGTYPMQSERLFHAISGLGGTARLVVLPHESHGYRARESVLHVLAEQFAWFDRYVLHAPDDE